MQTTLQKIKKFFDSHKKIVIYLVFVCFAIYIVPRLMMPKPILEEIAPSQVMSNCYFNQDKSITLTGKNLDYITGIYINGVWEPDCNIISVSEDSITIRLPDMYYTTDGKLSIQIQTKVNSDLFAKSNKQTFIVLSDEDIKTPVIKSVSPEKLIFDGGLIYQITVQGENLTADSRIMLNGMVMESSYDGTSVTIMLPYSDWYLEEQLNLQVVQFYDGYATSIKSNSSLLQAESIYATTIENEENVLKANIDFLLKYLSALRREDYIVIFSMKDGATNAVTSEVIEQMHMLGLNRNITAAGAHISYIAVLDGHQLIHEDIGTEVLTYDNDNLGFALHVESAHFEVGNNSVIQINGEEYSVNECGLNIVVYDKKSGQVIDSVSFNTYTALELKK